MNDVKILLTAKEVAALTGFSEGTIRHWTSQKRIPHVRVSSRCVRYTADAIRTWFAEMAVAPTDVNGVSLRAPRRTAEISKKLVEK